MIQRLFKREHTCTIHIVLDTHKCEACWKCRQVCSNQVIGRINLPWHKHIRFVNGDSCTGCLKCVKVCHAGAITKVTTPKDQTSHGNTF